MLAAAGCGSSDSGASVEELEKVVAELRADVDELAGRVVADASESAGVVPVAPGVVVESTYGFAFPLPAGVAPTYSGLAGGVATVESGSLVASAGGVSVVLLWLTDENPLTPSESVVSSFEVLRSSSGLEFALLSSGEESFTVDGVPAAYATFTVAEGSADVGVAVIGGWTCAGDGRSFALTVTGADEGSVGASFFELVESFRCEV